jgi:protein required for attachment to host cells
MTKTRIKAGEWVVVCDGAKALLLQNVGDEKFPNLRTQDVITQKDPPTHEQGTSSPGRVQHSVGTATARGAVEQTDWHAQAERAFLLQLVVRLDHAVGVGQIKSLIIVAPPRALGVIRQAYSHGLRAALRVEIDKDLVKMPLHEIERHLIG